MGICALLFAGSAAVTVIWCDSMSQMPGMHMPGGWVMSMTWMRMPGQRWVSAAGSFMGMWTVMMTAMMLPALIPMLLRYRRCLGQAGTSRPGLLTVAAATGYFSVWMLAGALIYPAGLALAGLAMQSPVLSRAVPLISGMTVLLAGVMQFTRWKTRQLAICRRSDATHADPATAWRHGVHLGLRCARCCANLMLVLIVAGVMDVLAMTIVTLFITAERLLPRGGDVARHVGALVCTSGMFLMLRAIGLA